MKKTTTARQLAQIWHTVKCQGIPYSKESFKKVGGATGARLYDVLIETRYYDPAIHEYVDTFIQASNKRSMKSNVPANWDVDKYARFIDNFVLGKADELGIEIIQKRGRKAGISPFKKEEPNLLEDVELPENPQIMEDEVLDGYDEKTGEWTNVPQEERPFIEEIFCVEGRPIVSDMQSRHEISEEQYRELANLGLKHTRETAFSISEKRVKYVHVVFVDDIIE